MMHARSIAFTSMNRNAGSFKERTETVAKESKVAPLPFFKEAIKPSNTMGPEVVFGDSSSSEEEVIETNTK